MTLLTTHSSSLTGDITIDASISGNNSYYYSLSLSLTAKTAAAIQINDLMDLSSLTATVTGGTITTDALIQTNANIALTATTTELNGYLDTDGGHITITGDLSLLSDISLDTYGNALYGTGGDVTISGTIEGTAKNFLSISADQGTVTFAGAIGGGGEIDGMAVVAGAISILANITITTNPLTGVSMTLDGDVTTTGNRIFDLSSAFSAVVNFSSGLVTLGGNLDVTFGSNGDLQIGSDFNAGVHNVTTNRGVSIEGTPNDTITYSGSGTLTADQVQVFSFGRLAVTGDGTLNIAAVSVAFDSETALQIDLAPAPGQLNVTGDVTISSNARIEGSGALTSAGPFTILTASAGVSGTFQGTAGGLNFFLGDEVVTADYTATTLSIERAVPGANTVSNADLSGAIYTVKLTGGGGAGLLVVDDPSTFGIEGIVVQNATLANRLIITVAANGGLPFVDLLRLDVDGSLAAIQAAAINLAFGDHGVTGYLKSATFRDVFGSLTLGGTPVQKTSLKGRIFDVDLTLGSRLNVLTGNEFEGSIIAPTAGKITMTTANGGNGDFVGDLTLNAGSSTAMALASVNTAGDLGGFWDINGKIGSVTVKQDVFDWNVTGGGNLGGISKILVTGSVSQSQINSVGRLAAITAGEWDSSSITADSIGSIKITGNAGLGLAGDWSGNVTVTGFANPGRVALKTFSVKGKVTDSTFNIQDGNVASFVVGKFLSSRLYLGLSTGGSLTSGTFSGDFKLGTFKTTALPLNPPLVDTVTVAFNDSEVCASRFGIVRLSSVAIDNAGTPFGLRVAAAANAGSVRVATVPFTPNVNLVPAALPLFGDFAFFATP